MLAVIVNTVAVLAGSLLGILFRNHIKQHVIDVLISALALITFAIGIASLIKSNDTLCMIICMVFGTFIGVALKLEKRINGAGDYVKNKLFSGSKQPGSFTEGFVTSCIVFCVGSMTIMGSLEAGINHNYTIIFAKSALDFITSMMFGAAMGVGVTCSAAFVLVFQGLLTLLATLLAPVLSSETVTEMSAVGGVILVGMGFNMLNIRDLHVRVADMLPAIFLPIAYLPLAAWISSLLH